MQSMTDLWGLIQLVADTDFGKTIVTSKRKTDANDDDEGEYEAELMQPR